MERLETPIGQLVISPSGLNRYTAHSTRRNHSTEEHYVDLRRPVKIIDLENELEKVRIEKFRASHVPHLNRRKSSLPGNGIRFKPQEIDNN